MSQPPSTFRSTSLVIVGDSVADRKVKHTSLTHVLKRDRYVRGYWAFKFGKHAFVRVRFTEPMTQESTQSAIRSWEYSATHAVPGDR